MIHFTFLSGLNLYNYTPIGKRLLSSAKQCPHCSTPTAMVTQTRRDVSDGYGWRCRTCKKRLGSRSKSFFDKSRLTLQQWLILPYWWAREYPVTDAREEARVSKKMAIDAYQWLREICSQKLTQTTIKLGGDGKIVHIDESLFKHKPKVRKAIVFLFGPPEGGPIFLLLSLKVSGTSGTM